MQNWLQSGKLLELQGRGKVRSPEERKVCSTEVKHLPWERGSVLQMAALSANALFVCFG